MKRKDLGWREKNFCLADAEFTKEKLIQEFLFLPLSGHFSNESACLHPLMSECRLFVLFSTSRLSGYHEINTKEFLFFKTVLLHTW